MTEKNARSRKAMSVFLDDASRVAHEALVNAREMGARVGRGEWLRAEQVGELYQVIHTLKGTAAMISGAEGVATALHEVESALTVQPLETSAARPDWLPRAEAALGQTLEVLEKLKHSAPTGETTVPRSPEASRRGLLVVSAVDGTKRTLWFGYDEVARVLSPEETRGRRVAQWDGCWVPVIQAGAEDGAGFGLCVLLEASGRAVGARVVFVVDEIRGAMTLEEAREKKTFSGVGFVRELLSTWDMMAEPHLANHIESSSSAAA